MCYSVESSLTAWAVSVAIACYLWYRDNGYDRWNASFIWTFSIVQLWEAGLWATNKDIFVKLITVSLALQPLIQTFGAWQVTRENILKPVIAFYSLVLLYAIYRSLVDQFSSSIGPNGHLVWETDRGTILGGDFPILNIVYIVGLFWGLFWGLPKTIPLIVIGAGTLLWSLSRVATGEIASYWCFIAVAYSITAVLI